MAHKVQQFSKFPKNGWSHEALTVVVKKSFDFRMFRRVRLRPENFFRVRKFSDIIDQSKSDTNFEEFGIRQFTPSNVKSGKVIESDQELLDLLDSKVEIIKPISTNQSEQLESYSNQIGENVNRNSNLRILLDDFNVDLNKMRRNCHLFRKSSDLNFSI